MISLRLEEQMEKKLERQCRALGLSKSEVVRLSLQAFLDNLKQATPYELGKDLFGAFSSGEGTRSTEKRKSVSSKIREKKGRRPK